LSSAGSGRLCRSRGGRVAGLQVVLCARANGVASVSVARLHGVGADFVAVVTGEALGHRRVERVAPAVVDLVRSLDGTTSTGARVYLWGDELTRADGRNNIEHKSERVALRA